MIKTIDLGRDLAGLVTLEGRGPHTTEEEAQDSFMKLADFRDGALFAASFSGASGWERHLKGDEIVQILEGSTRLDIIVGDERESHHLSAGMLLVVTPGLLAPVLLRRRRQGADRNPAADRTPPRR